MDHILNVAEQVPTAQKVMLSCFLANSRGIAFYRKLGFEKDPWSPGPRNLRGKTVEPDYMIMSKAVKAKNQAPPESSVADGEGCSSKRAKR